MCQLVPFWGRGLVVPIWGRSLVAFFARKKATKLRPQMALLYSIRKFSFHILQHNVIIHYKQ